MLELILIVAVAVLINVASLIRKLKKGLYITAIIDAAVLGMVLIFFTGSMTMFAAGTVGSAMVSIYLGIFPVRINDSLENKKK